MTTMTMTTTSPRVEAARTARFEPEHTKGVSQVVPMLLGFTLLAASAVLSVLISGPMH